jgi:DNA-binding NtrC family response regulator
MTAQVLSRLGYEPVSFSDSHAALAAFEAAPRSFDVLVIDDVMPGLTGTGLASVWRQQRRELPIVLVRRSRRIWVPNRAVVDVVAVACPEADRASERDWPPRASRPAD